MLFRDRLSELARVRIDREFEQKTQHVGGMSAVLRGFVRKYNADPEEFADLDLDDASKRAPRPKKKKK